MTWEEFYESLSRDQRRLPAKVSYPDLRNDTAVVTKDLEWDADQQALAADLDAQG